MNADMIPAALSVARELGRAVYLGESVDRDRIRVTISTEVERVAGHARVYRITVAGKLEPMPPMELER